MYIYIYENTGLQKLIVAGHGTVVLALDLVFPGTWHLVAKMSEDPGA